MSGKGKRKRSNGGIRPIQYTCRDCREPHTSIKTVTFDDACVAELYLDLVPDNYYNRAREYVFKGKEDAEIAAYIYKARLGYNDDAFRIFKVAETNVDNETDNIEEFIVCGGMSMDIRHLTTGKVGDKAILDISISSIKSYTIMILEQHLKSKFVKDLILKPIAQGVVKDVIRYCDFEYHTLYTFADIEDEPRDIILVSKTGRKHVIHRYVALASSTVLRNGIMKFKGDKSFTLNCDDKVLEWLTTSMYTGIYIFNDQIDKHVALEILDYLHIADKKQICKSIIERLNKAFGDIFPVV